MHRASVSNLRDKQPCAELPICNQPDYLVSDTDLSKLNTLYIRITFCAIFFSSALMIS